MKTIRMQIEVSEQDYRDVVAHLTGGRAGRPMVTVRAVIDDNGDPIHYADETPRCEFDVHGRVCGVPATHRVHVPHSEPMMACPTCADELRDALGMTVEVL